MQLTSTPQAWDGSAISALGWAKVNVWCTADPDTAYDPQGAPANEDTLFATQSVSQNIGTGVSTVATLDAAGLYTLPGNQFLRLNGGDGGAFYVAGAQG